MPDPDSPASLSPKQARSILDANARVNIWEGSVRSGKTIASLIAWLRYVDHAAPSTGRLFMIGRTKDTLARNIVAVIEDLFPPGDPAWRYTTGANTAQLFGRTIDMLGANDAQAEAKIRGATLAGAYVDEATLLPGHGFWTQLLNRMSLDGARLFATTNPDGPMHWFKAEVIDRADELGYTTTHFVLEDNPGLTDEYVAQVKAENVGLWYKRNILGLWVLAEGTIWDMWDHDRHVVDDLPDLERCLLSIDYGTAGVFAATLLGHGHHDGQPERLYVAREWRWDARKERRQLTDAEFSRRLRAQVDGWAETIPAARMLDRVAVDPSATSFITQLHRDGWERVRGADNAVADGIREVATLLAADRMRVHRSCTGLTTEIPGYVWDPKASIRGEDKPIKANDHSCLVAGTMVATEHGRKPIEQVRRSDRVWTRDGLAPVVAAGCTGLSVPVVEVALSSGEVLVATPDHPVWVLGRGWVTLDALRYGDRTATTSAGSAGVRVLSVTGRGRADVFNLTVAGAPEFFANGVLVHNCDAMRYGVRGARRWWRGWLGHLGPDPDPT